MQNYTLPSIEQMELLCYGYQLDGTDIFDVLSDDEKIAEWNGFGPDRFPRWLRSFLSFFESAILPACYIHDLDFAVGGQKKYFFRSNRRFRRNALKCLSKNKHFYWLPYRIVLIVKIFLIEAICDLFGYRGWNKRQ